MSIWCAHCDAIRRFLGRWRTVILSGRRDADDANDFVGFCVRLSCVGVCLQCSEGGTTDPSVHQEAWFLQCSPSSSIKCIFIFIMFCLTVINSLNLPSQHAQSKDIFPHLCIVSEVSGVHFLWYVLYYSDGKWVHVYICKSVGRLSTRDGLFHSGKLSAQREEDWKLSTPQRNVFFFTPGKEKHVLLW